MSAVSLTGRRIGSLVVGERVGTHRFPSGASSPRYEVVCDCGAVKTAISGSLRNGHTMSCGCMQRERARVQFTKHGSNATPEHRIWRAMLRRCEDAKSPAFASYGGRGITVCEAWHCYETFLSDVGPRPSPELSLDRIDNDRGYEPGNVRWATAQEQASNRRNNRFVSLGADVVTLAEAARRLGISYTTAATRLARGQIQAARRSA